MSADPSADPAPGEPRLLPHLLFFPVAAVFALYFTSLRFAKPEWGPCSLETLMAGQGFTPFQYRALLPWIIRWAADHLLPLPGISTPRGLAFVIEAGAVFLTLWVFRYYLGFFFRSAILRSLLALSLVFVLPYNYLLSRAYPFWLVYDMPALLFFTLGIVLLYRRRWVLYYPLFALATVNRETTCFLTVIYLLTAVGRERLGRVAAHGVAQFAVWAGIKLFLYRLYADNGGAGLYLRNAATNIHTLTQDPGSWVIILSSMGFIWFPVAVFWRRVRDAFVRRALWSGPLFLLLMFRMGNLPEVRIYAEMIPVFLPAYLLILADLIRRAEPLSAAEAGRF
jgi:hypothetical protein